MAVNKLGFLVLLIIQVFFASVEANENDKDLENLCSKLNFKNGCHLSSTLTKSSESDEKKFVVSQIQLRHGTVGNEHEPKSEFTAKNKGAISHLVDAIYPTSQNRLCYIKVIVDHTFYNYYQNRGFTLENILRLIFAPIARSFRELDLNGNDRKDGYQIALGGNKVFRNKEAEDYPLKDELLSPIEVLEKLSHYGKEKSCLTVTLMSRDFSQYNTLGMGYAASSNPKGPDGGICSQFQYYPGKGQMRLNNIFVTNRFGKDYISLPGLQSVLFHLIAQSFGSGHDSIDDPRCSGSEKPSKVYSVPLNGLHITECDLMRMNAVIRKKGYCMSEEYNKLAYSSNKCGNGVIDRGEYCDCGTEETCQYIDKCCVPNECRLNSALGYECTPLLHDCCNDLCRMASPNDRQVCEKWNECRTTTHCDGRYYCPPVDWEPKNRHPCEGSSRTCDKGSCNSTICQDYNLQNCECNEPLHFQCRVCCIKDGKCRSHSDLNLQFPPCPLYHANAPLRRATGSSCLNGFGVCDLRGKCKMHSDNPFVDRGTGFLRKGDYRSFWKNYWFYILLAVLSIYLIYACIRDFIRERRIMKKVVRFERAVANSRKKFIVAPHYWNERVLNNASRLAALFPRAPVQDIVDVCNQMEPLDDSIFEKKSVQKLLEQGHFIRTKFSPLKPLNSV